MKKLMMVVCAAAIATCAQAAKVSWGSGQLYTAASKTGGWSSTLVSDASVLANVTMSVYLVDSSTYATVSAKSQEGMYSWASDKTASYTGANKNTQGTIIPAVTAGSDSLSASTTYYSILTIEYTDATYGKMYMATAKEFTTTASAQKSVANIFGGAASLSTGGVRNWQPVPEPTSAMLLMLGLCGLALKRKNA